MNWLSFLLWVGGVYLLYYLFIMAFDVIAAKRPVTSGAAGNELTFSDHFTPVELGADINDGEAAMAQKPLAEAIAPLANESEMIGSGGVVIDNLFRLCKQEAVIYTRSVSF